MATSKPHCALYETARLPRANQIQAMSWDNKTRFHLPDGPAQEARDATMAQGMTDWSYRAVAWVYAHDAVLLDGNPEIAQNRRTLTGKGTPDYKQPAGGDEPPSPPLIFELAPAWVFQIRPERQGFDQSSWPTQPPPAKPPARSPAAL